MAAAEAGADVISGTFLGLGERTGNTPLEAGDPHARRGRQLRASTSTDPPVLRRACSLRFDALFPIACRCSEQAFADPDGDGTRPRC